MRKERRSAYIPVAFPLLIASLNICAYLWSALYPQAVTLVPSYSSLVKFLALGPGASFQLFAIIFSELNIVLNKHHTIILVLKLFFH